MKIYYNSQFVSELKRFVIMNQGNWMSSLIGVNLKEDTQGNLHIFPVYRGIRLVRLHDCTLLEIPFFQKRLIFALDKWWLKIMLIGADKLEISDIGNSEEN